MLLTVIEHLLLATSAQPTATPHRLGPHFERHSPHQPRQTISTALTTRLEDNEIRPWSKRAVSPQFQVILLPPAHRQPRMAAPEAMLPSSSPISSPLSSIASRSPSPPVDYPSPPSSNVSDTGVSPSKSRDAPDRDEPPPSKRQKIVKPRELKTEHLDLRRLNDSDDDEHHKIQDAKLRKLMEALRSKRKIVVIAGAGISVSAGSMFNIFPPT
jgi:hypothetical protein